MLGMIESEQAMCWSQSRQYARDDRVRAGNMLGMIESEQAMCWNQSRQYARDDGVRAGNVLEG